MVGLRQVIPRQDNQQAGAQDLRQVGLVLAAAGCPDAVARTLPGGGGAEVSFPGRTGLFHDWPGGQPRDHAPCQLTSAAPSSSIATAPSWRMPTTVPTLLWSRSFPVCPRRSDGSK